MNNTEINKFLDKHYPINEDKTVANIKSFSQTDVREFMLNAIRLMFSEQIFDWKKLEDDWDEWSDDRKEQWSFTEGAFNWFKENVGNYQTNKVYIVEASSGSYDTKEEFIVGVYTNKEEAEQARIKWESDIKELQKKLGSRYDTEYNEYASVTEIEIGKQIKQI